MEHESFFMEPRNWVLIAFFIFFGLFGSKIWGALASMLDARAAKIRAELDEAARLRREAEDMLKAAQKSRDEALADAKRLIEGAQAEAARLTAATAAEAEAAAKRREQMAVDRIAAAEKAAVDEVRYAAVDVAGIAARQVIAEGMTHDASTALVDQAIAQLPSALARRAA
jgi:F-type H+-transporting ATPase subunit b